MNKQIVGILWLSGISISLLTMLIPCNPQIAFSQTTIPEADSQVKKLEDFAEITKDAEKLIGLFTIYRREEQVYLEIKPEQLNRNFFCVTTLASGLGELGLYSGLPIRDFIFQFQKINSQKINLVIPNVYFRTQSQDPQQRNLKDSFSDSVILTANIISINPETKGILIDLSLLTTNDQEISGLSSYLANNLGAGLNINQDNSILSKLELFPNNLELESSHNITINYQEFWGYPQTLADDRAFILKVHYSLSELPVTNYRPRLADPRVGYFQLTHQNISHQNQQDSFVRYIKRWHLEKVDKNAVSSPPKKPIVFWIENTVPLEYREPIKEGILWWNQAFEKIGFINAIEVKQMPDNADWNPEDIRYNTIRWFNSLESPFIAMGPSRVNPITAEILDTDILIDGNAIRSLPEEYKTFVAKNNIGSQSFFTKMIEQYLSCQYYPQIQAISELKLRQSHLIQPIISSLTQKKSSENSCLDNNWSSQISLGSLSLSLTQKGDYSKAELDDYVKSFLRWLVAHEVGHSLGLRHNFKGSTLLNIDQLNDPKVTKEQGLAASVMDYLPPNLALPGQQQGEYFTSKLGVYDLWAIEYGYREIPAINTEQEVPQLQNIASRSSEPGLSYGTDEDMTSFTNAEINVWDLSSDPLTYAQQQIKYAHYLLQKLDDYYLLPTENYGNLRTKFDLIITEYCRNSINLISYVGGQKFSRDYPNRINSNLPLRNIALTQQKQALGLINQYVFAEDAFQFSPQLLSKLVSNQWQDLGSAYNRSDPDYPISELIQDFQTLFLGELLSSERLQHIQDAELKALPEESLTLTELFTSIETGIWTEILDKSSLKNTISSQRRNLQRQHLKMMINLTLANSPTEINSYTDLIMVLLMMNPPEDARVLARYQLQQLQKQINSFLRSEGDHLDTLTKAHLEDSQLTITQALEGIKSRE